MSGPYATEADLVRCFVAQLQAHEKRTPTWTVYPETEGWDLVLLHRDGFQVGLEAKLTLNAKVIDQAIDSGMSKYRHHIGPDYRGVLVPERGCQNHMVNICRAIGVGIIGISPPEPGTYVQFSLPGEESYSTVWPHWVPSQRLALPDYVPDVEGGHSAPVKLTPWKVAAIKLLIILERRGYVTRADMKALSISPTRWTDHYYGFLDRAPQLGGYVRNSRTPDLKAQHPVNWPQIEADTAIWAKDINLEPVGAAPLLELTNAPQGGGE